MNVYVSGRLNNDEHVRSIMERLWSHGYTVTCDWTQYVPGVNITHRELAELEFNGVLEADVLVVAGVTEGGVGCWLEVGAALSRLKPVLLVGHCRESLFWHLPDIHRVADDGAMITWLENHGY